MKIIGRQNNASSVARKVGQSLIVHKEIRKTAIKRKAITISPDLVDPVNKASLTLAG